MRAAAIVTGSLLCLALSSLALAEGDKGKGHGGKHSESVVVVPSREARIVVTDRDRIAVRSYFHTEYVDGRCPPGLAKKGNGCLPPGQAARLWAVGQPLPAAVAYEPLPQALLVQLTPAPAGYAYVRVGNDILLMVTASRMISEPIADLALLEEPTQVQPLVSDRDRDAVNSYYRTEYLNGTCPDDLVRSGDGCSLPASAPERPWALGEPLPPAVVYQPLPAPLIAQLAPAPAGYQYVRVGDEIVLLAITSRVVAQRVVTLGQLRAPGQAILYESGHCPPGLAKKNNGCLPPGHAK
jgi:Ni/Co efflux regulator RcnB